MKLNLNIKSKYNLIHGKENILFFCYGYNNKYYFGFIDNDKFYFDIEENISDDFNFNINLKIKIENKIELDFENFLIQINEDENGGDINYGFKSNDLKTPFLFKGKTNLKSCDSFDIKNDDFINFIHYNYIDKIIIDDVLKNFYQYGLNQKLSDIKSKITKKDIFKNIVKKRRIKNIKENYLQKILDINFLDIDDVIRNIETSFLKELSISDAKEDKGSMYILYSYIKYVFNINYFINKYILKIYLIYGKKYPYILIKYLIYLNLILLIDFKNND